MRNDRSIRIPCDDRILALAHELAHRERSDLTSYLRSLIEREALKAGIKVPAVRPKAVKR